MIVNKAAVKFYLCAFGAGVVHCLILLASTSFNDVPNTALKEHVLSIKLENIDERKNLINSDVEKPVLTNIEARDESNTVSKTPPSEADELLASEVKVDAPISQSVIEQWAKQESSEYLNQREKTDLSKPRKNSYTDAWLSPDRVDTRDSEKDTKIRTPDGMIRVSKVNGRLICILVHHDGTAMSFNCGETILNLLLEKSGGIKNSDREEWLLDD